MPQEYTPSGSPIAYTVPAYADVVDGPTAFKSFADDVYSGLAAKAALASPAFTGSPTLNGAPLGGGLTFITSGTVSAGSALSINNCFSATYLNYKVILTTNVATTFRLRVGGADNSSSNYVLQFVVGSAASVTGARSAAGTSWDIGGSGIVEMDFFSPFAAVASVGLGFGVQGGATATISTFNCHHNVASSFDGFSLLGTTMTATAKVYGYQN